jgi:hypothetical protein
VDTQAPNITCPKDIEQTAPQGLAQVIVNFPAPYATDNDQVNTAVTIASNRIASHRIASHRFGVSAVMLFSCLCRASQVANQQCSLNSGSIFKLGTTEVQCSVVDAAGNKATCTFKVTVLGTECPGAKAQSENGIDVCAQPSPTTACGEGERMGRGGGRGGI